MEEAWSPPMKKLRNEQDTPKSGRKRAQEQMMIMKGSNRRSVDVWYEVYSIVYYETRLQQ